MNAGIHLDDKRIDMLGAFSEHVVAMRIVMPDTSLAFNGGNKYVVMSAFLNDAMTLDGIR